MNQLPIDFLQRMESQMNSNEFQDFIDSFAQLPQTSIRLNPLKNHSIYAELQTIDWLEEGKVLTEKKQFIIDPLWHAGAYYVQESSSMIYAHIFKQIFSNSTPKRALDLCAAPGGKSTLLQSLLDSNSLLVANEVIKSRAQILKENHIRLGLSENLVITQNDPKHFSKFDELFDYIQLDAPCSGEGMFRRDETARKEWSQANCQLCSERQNRIIADIQNTLAKDGFLVYSTCTFNPKENEELIHWATENFDLESISIDFPENWNITPVEFKGVFGYYFYPHKVKGEGLFVSVLKKKKGFGLVSIPQKAKAKSIEIPYLNSSENIIQNENQVCYETELIQNFKHHLSSKLNIIYAGIELGEIKGKDFLPGQALANFHQQLHLFPQIEVDLETALEFLRGNDPKVSSEQKGIFLITYKKLGLGFIKFLGNRSNNYYPKSWRIKHF